LSVSRVQIFIGKSAAQNRRIMPCANWPDITNKFPKQILKTWAQLRAVQFKRGAIISKNLGAISKFFAPDRCHEASSVLKTRK